MGPAGFTLIEILSAMAVLLILVMLLGRLFSDASKAWLLGTRRAEQNIEARAILDFITRDVQQAVADDVLAFRLCSEDKEVFGTGGQGWLNDAIWFVSLSNDPDSTTTPRAAREIRYYVSDMTEIDGSTPLLGRYRLMRGTRTGAVKCYGSYDFWTNTSWKSEVVAENLASFEVWCVGVSNSPNGAVYKNLGSYNTLSEAIPPWYYGGQNISARGYQYHKLPAYIEILFTKLDEPDAIRAAEMFKAAGGSYAAVQDYVNRTAKRHEIRINLQNRNGYAPDR
ncbi:MAG: prepilin-type N-terminal cleavage/methylation domain-containing protein [Verrucomicrobiota bacterium]